MKTFRTGRNLLIVNKEAELFDSLEIKDSKLFISAVHKKIKTIEVKKIHACLYCRELQNITMILREDSIQKVTLITEKTEVFDVIIEELKMMLESVEFSMQDKKINGYSSAIIEKLQEGTVLTIIDKKDETEIRYCPDCGMQCDPSIPYCMECGAMIG